MNTENLNPVIASIFEDQIAKPNEETQFPLYFKTVAYHVKVESKDVAIIVKDMLPYMDEYSIEKVKYSIISNLILEKA